MSATIKSKKVVKNKKVLRKYTVYCTNPVNDGVFDIAGFEQFLQTKTKVTKRGKTGQLGKDVNISRDETTVTVATKVPLAKRYVKYLTKKFMKKNGLTEYLNVTSKGKNGYVVNFFKLGQSEEAQE